MNWPQAPTAAPNVPPNPPTPPVRRQGVLVYLAILATVYVVASLVLGIVNYQSAQSNARKIEQLQTDTNDNLCNQ